MVDKGNRWCIGSLDDTWQQQPVRESGEEAKHAQSDISQGYTPLHGPDHPVKRSSPMIPLWKPLGRERKGKGT